MEKLYFVIKLIPPRPTFVQDMSQEEHAIMMQHIAYWEPHIKSGTMVVTGPVFDPKGGYGLGIVRIDSEDQLKQLIAEDPAVGLNSCEYYPMMATTIY